MSPLLLSTSSNAMAPMAPASLVSSSAAGAAQSSKSEADTVLRRIGPWREMQGSDGDVYYWNKFTGVVTWTHPKQLPHDQQNPGVTSVAAALQKMQAKELKGGGEHYGVDDAADMLASAIMLRPQSAGLRSQAELSHAASADDGDGDVDGDGDGDDDDGHVAAAAAASRSSVMPAKSASAMAIGTRESNSTLTKSEDDNVKKKLSAIRMW